MKKCANKYGRHSGNEKKSYKDEFMVNNYSQIAFRLKYL